MKLFNSRKLKTGLKPPDALGITKNYWGNTSFAPISIMASFTRRSSISISQRFTISNQNCGGIRALCWRSIVKKSNLMPLCMDPKIHGSLVNSGQKSVKYLSLAPTLELIGTKLLTYLEWKFLLLNYALSSWKLVGPTLYDEVLGLTYRPLLGLNAHLRFSGDSWL